MPVFPGGDSWWWPIGVLYMVVVSVAAGLWGWVKSWFVISPNYRNVPRPPPGRRVSPQGGSGTAPPETERSELVRTQKAVGSNTPFRRYDDLSEITLGPSDHDRRRHELAGGRVADLMVMNASGKPVRYRTMAQHDGSLMLMIFGSDE